MFHYLLSISTLLLAITVYSSDAQKWSWGRCPTVTTKDPFDINQYLGTWYEITKFPNWFQSGKCGQAVYTLKEDGHINVENTEIVDGKPNQAVGDAYRPDDSQPGKLKVRFSRFSPYGDYWVIKTDYTNYTMVYSCRSILGIGKMTFAWILSRERTLAAATEASLKSDLTAFGVDVSPFVATDQSNC